MNKNLIAVILIAVGAGIYFTVTQDMIAAAKEVKEKNDRIATALNNAEEIIRFRNKLTDDYNAISVENRNALDKMIPSAVDNIRLVIDLNNNIAQANGFALADVRAYVASTPGSGTADTKPASPTAAPTAVSPVSAGPRIGEPTLDKVSVTFKAKATYDQFRRFMTYIERDLRVMDLTKLSIKANDTDTYDFDVAYDTYWLRQ